MRKTMTINVGDDEDDDDEMLTETTTMTRLGSRQLDDEEMRKTKTIR